MSLTSMKKISIKENNYVKTLKEYAKKENAEVVTICAKIEAELSELDDEDKKELLNDSRYRRKVA